MSCGCGNGCNTTQLPASTTPGPAGVAGADGLSVIGANISPTGTLTLSMSDGSVITATGNAQGPQGAQGVAGDDGVDGTVGKYILVISGQDIINNGNNITLSPSLIASAGVPIVAGLSLTWSNVVINVLAQTNVSGQTISQTIAHSTTTSGGWGLLINETAQTMVISFTNFPINATSNYKVVIM